MIDERCRQALLELQRAVYLVQSQPGESCVVCMVCESLSLIGDGKTYFIQGMMMMQSRSVQIVVDESFSVLRAITDLQALYSMDRAENKTLGIFFNFVLFDLKVSLYCTELCVPLLGVVSPVQLC